MVCEHGKFEAAVIFHRLTDHDGGPLLAVHMEVLARCAGCHTPLTWTGPPTGIDPDRATVSPNRQELRVPATVNTRPRPVPDL